MNFLGGIEMPKLPETEDLVRYMWRLPIWGPVIRGIGLFGKPFIHSCDPPPLGPIPDPAPLDAFADGSRGSFRAGAARVDITPPEPVGTYLAGFAANRTCTGVRDPLSARTLVLTDGATPLVIVALDLIGLSLVRTSRIRSMLSRKFPHSVMLVCTHNHQSPDTLGLWGVALAGVLPYRTGLDQDYMSFLESRIVDSVRQAIEKARPASLHLAQGAFDSQGKWVHNERSPLLDRDMRVVQLDDERGECIATLVQHACHPETLWKKNRLISADFCGVCCRLVEEQVGGVALYVNGALGAMVSAAIGWETPEDERERVMVGLGQAMARQAVRLVRRARKKRIEEPHIRVGHGQVRFPEKDNHLFALIHALGVVEHRELAGGLLSEVSFVRLGPASMVGLPGEPAPALGLEILERVPGSPKLLLGLAGDELGYLLPPEFFHDPAYGYERSMSPGPLTATRLALAVEAAVAQTDPGG